MQSFGISFTLSLNFLTSLTEIPPLSSTPLWGTPVCKSIDTEEKLMDGRAWKGLYLTEPHKVVEN